MKRLKRFGAVVAVALFCVACGNDITGSGNSEAIAIAISGPGGSTAPILEICPGARLVLNLSKASMVTTKNTDLIEVKYLATTVVEVSHKGKTGTAVLDFSETDQHFGISLVVCPPGPVTPGQAPMLTFTGNPTQLLLGQGSMFKWVCTGTTLVSSPGNWIANKGLADSIMVVPTTVGTHTYTLVCSNQYGSDTKSVTLNVTDAVQTTYHILPTGPFPLSSVNGQCTTGVQQFQLYNQSNQLVSVSSWTIGGTTNNSSNGQAVWTTAGTYPVAANGPAASIQVQVTGSCAQQPGAPDFNFSPNPTSITAGQSSSLSWNPIQNVASCPSSSFGGAKPISGSESVQPASTITYSLTCANSAGVSVTKYATVTVQSAPPPPAPTCTVTSFSYSPAGGTAYVNRQTNLAVNTPVANWSPSCQVVWYVNKPSVDKILGADATYQICDANGNNCVWYYAGIHAVLTGVYPGSDSVCARVIEIGADQKWRFTQAAPVCHTWTIQNPPPGIMVDPWGTETEMPLYHDLDWVQQTLPYWAT